MYTDAWRPAEEFLKILNSTLSWNSLTHRALLENNYSSYPTKPINCGIRLNSPKQLKYPSALTGKTKYALSINLVPVSSNKSIFTEF